jgi:hypothetical protein
MELFWIAQLHDGSAVYQLDPQGEHSTLQLRPGSVRCFSLSPWTSPSCFNLTLEPNEKLIFRRRVFMCHGAGGIGQTEHKVVNYIVGKQYPNGSMEVYLLDANGILLETAKGFTEGHPRLYPPVFLSQEGIREVTNV